VVLDDLIKQNHFVMVSPSHRYVYLMGLIDYLGRWNLQKKSELYGKTFLAHFIRQNTDFSVKPPHEFAHRFLKKVKRIFKVHNSESCKRKNLFESDIMMGNDNYMSQMEEESKSLGEEPEDKEKDINIFKSYN
jgi:hypothetical protein